MYFIYKAYKNNKDKKAAAETELPHYDRKLTDPSLDGSLEDRPPPSAIAMSQQDVPTPEMAMPTQTLDDKRAARKQWIILAVTLFVDIVIPLILYYVLKNYISTLAALLISSAPPIVMIVGKFIIYRQFDPLGLIIVFGFVLSAILSVVDGNPRILILKDSIVSSATGAIFLLSLLPIRLGKYNLRPLTYGISAEMMSAAPKVQYVKDGEAIEQTPTQFSWEHVKLFRNGMRMLTAMWGVVLLLEFVARLIMYFSTLTIDQLVLYSNVVLGVLLGTMGVFTIIYSHRLRTKTRKEVREILARYASEAVTSPNAGSTNIV
ncbi:unnamed protein product [Umbelopsis ramanniana]